jgi:hypothetical protein
MARDEMMQAAEIPMLERRVDLAGRSIEHGMLVDLHVERAPARVVNALVKAGADAEQRQLALLDAVPKRSRHE